MLLSKRVPPAATSAVAEVTGQLQSCHKVIKLCVELGGYARCYTEVVKQVLFYSLESSD